MANLTAAVDFVLKQEDASLSGDVTTLPGDSGGATRFGLASADHPDLIRTGYYNPSIVPTTAALSIAEQVYISEYADPMHAGSITDQALATAVLSFGINSGTGQAARTLQSACVSLGQDVTVDGDIGPETLATVNSLNASQLLNTFCSGASTFYTGLAESNPEDAAFLQGWLNRVAAWQTYAASLQA
jgi:lysozyme family protein